MDKSQKDSAIIYQKNELLKEAYTKIESMIENKKELEEKLKLYSAAIRKMRSERI